MVLDAGTIGGLLAAEAATALSQNARCPVAAIAPTNAG